MHSLGLVVLRLLTEKHKRLSMNRPLRAAFEYRLLALIITVKTYQA